MWLPWQLNFVYILSQLAESYGTCFFHNSKTRRRKAACDLGTFYTLCTLTMISDITVNVYNMHLVSDDRRSVKFTVEYGQYCFRLVNFKWILQENYAFLRKMLRENYASNRPRNTIECLFLLLGVGFIFKVSATWIRWSSASLRAEPLAPDLKNSTHTVLL